ncbi:MAG: tripartite tricarboxylate transporter substrate binding protein, partial [Betaproteobacteria bacterium]
ANGAIGLTRLAKSAPDGYTIALGATTNLAVSPHLNPKLPYDPLKDFAPIALLARVPIVLVVSSAVPARSVDELVALARAHPGKLNYGSIGAGSTGHLLGETLRRRAGIDIVHVPYKGAAPGVTALLAGDVQFFFFPVFVDAKALVRSGALRPLALVDSRRSPVAPDLPTLPELGYPLEAAAWFALIAPAGTPEAIVQRLAQEVRRVLSLEAMRRFLDDHGIEAGDLGPEALKAYIASEHARYGRMVRETGVQVE